MAVEIEIVSDGDGAVIVGDANAVQRFLDGVGLLSEAQRFDLARLSGWLETGASTAVTLSGIAEHSAMYLKLTPESAQRLKDAGGLLKTKTDGISHIMLGEPGKKSLKWLQAEDGSASLLANPAVLSGIGGLMSQAAQQLEAQELRSLLLRIDEKLDDERRARRDKELAKLESLADALEEARTVRRHGGDPGTTWAKVDHLSEAITEVQKTALTALRALADKVESKQNARELKRTLRQIQGDVALQLAILARCFELQDEFRVVELDHVLDTSLGRLDGHRSGLAEIYERRRDTVLGLTTTLMARLDAAAAVANEQAILHPGAARFVVEALNATAALVADFHTPLGIETQREDAIAVSRRQALRDPWQLRNAGREIGEKAVLVAASAGAVAGAAVMAKKGTEAEGSEG